MAITEVSVCNIALQRLGASRIISLTDATPVGVQCNLCYEHLRNKLLRSHRWNFAIKRASLAALSSSPAPEFVNAFQLPEDCLRVLPPNDRELDWTFEGGVLLTNYSAPLNIRYVSKVTNSSLFDPLFADALSASVAEQISGTLAEYASKTEAMKDWRKESLKEARRLNAFESISDELPEDDWVAVRRSVP